MGFTQQYPTVLTLYESLSLLMIIAQVYNFILLMTYFCLADPFAEMTLEN